MPQKKRLELKPDHNLLTQQFYPTKIFVFVLDVQIFYERGSVLKTILPSGQIKYIFLSTAFETFKIGRSVGLGCIEGNNFTWVDFYPNPTFSLCIEWVIAFLRYLHVSLFFFCIVFYTEIKEKREPKHIFGLFIYYLIYSLHISGWGLPFHRPSFKLFRESRHFLSVCLTTVNDLPFIKINELEKAYTDTRTSLLMSEKATFAELKELENTEIPLPKKIKIIYWILQQVSQKKISNQFSMNTWGTCADLLLYYAQSLRLWIP